MNVANRQETITPPPLQRGDTIGLTAPAGPITAEVLQHGVQLLQGAGLKVRVGHDILRRDAYLAGTDEQRLRELHALWDDDQVKAVLAVRGGFGCIRFLPNLDFELMARKPKLLIGFSDLTVLLNAVHAKTGISTMHAPMLSTLVRDGRPAVETLLTALRRPSPREIRPKGLEILRAGQAKGPLIGGNLKIPITNDDNNNAQHRSELSTVVARLD